MRPLLRRAVLACLVPAGFLLVVSPACAEKGAIVFFEQHYLNGNRAGDAQIAALGLSVSGKLTWPAGKGVVEVAGRQGYVQRAPVAIRDAAGGAIVAFEAEARSGSSAGDTDIWAQRVDASGKLLWNDGAGPVVIAGSALAETDPVIVSDSGGGAIVVYARRPKGGDDSQTVIQAQRLSASGALVWSAPVEVVSAEEGVTVAPKAVAAPDGVGGVIVAYEITYTSGDYAGDRDLSAQRISQGGDRLWPTEDMGVSVSSSKGLERNPVLVPDGSGGVIAIYEIEFRSGDNAGDCDILAQRVSADGKLLWNEGDRSAFISSGTALERSVVALPDGKGGALVACEAEFREGDHKGDIDVLAQRVSADGTLLWNKGESSALVASSRWRERNPVMVTDGRGGAIIIFEQHAPPDAYAGDIDLASERITADGEIPWSTEENRAVDISDKDDYLERAPAAAPDGSDGAIVVFEAEARIGKQAGRADLLAQRFDASGKPLWNSGSPITLASGDTSDKHPVVVVP